MGDLFRFKQLFLACAAGGLLSLSPVAMAQKTTPVKDSSRVSSTGLTGEILGQFMLAEIAAARGDLVLAAQVYIDLSKQTRDPRMARRAAEVAMASHQVSLVGDASFLWMQTDPQSEDAVRFYTSAVVNGYGKLEDLETPLGRLLGSASVPIEPLLMQLPQFYARYPDKAAAVAPIERLTSPYINLPEANFARAQAYIAAGRPVDAEPAINRALELKPDWEAAILLKVQATPKNQQTQVMEQLRQFCEAHPQALDARMTYIRWLINEKRTDEAKEAYQKLAMDFPDNNAVLYGVAGLSALAGDLKTTEKYLQTLISAEFRDVNLLHLQLGEVYELENRSVEALQEYAFVSSGPYQLTAKSKSARLLARQGKLADARTLLQKAAADNPAGSSDYVLAEASLLRERNDLAGAQAVIHQLLLKNPDNPVALYESAMLSDRLGDYKGMESGLRRLIKLQPDYAHAYNALGYSFADRNVHLDEASQLLDKAIKLAPGDPAIMDSVGWLHYRKGDLKVALDYLQQAYSKLRDAEVAAHLGQVQWALGNKDAARSTWETALKEDPQSKTLLDIMKKFGSQ